MSYIFALIAALGLVVADQLTKNYIVAHFVEYQTQPVIEGVFHITYVQNPGAAFGIFKNQPWIFLSITTIVLLVCISLLIKKTFRSPIMHWALFLVLAGGVGNMIDRIFRVNDEGIRYVVDFLDFRLINFPVFNIADCCVVIGAALIVLYFAVDTVKDLKRTRQRKCASKEPKEGQPPCEPRS